MRIFSNTKLTISQALFFIFLICSCKSSYSQFTANKQPENNAIFTIKKDVVNDNLLPYTASIGGFGNSLINVGSGFEPVVFRNKVVATRDSQNKIYVQRDQLTGYDTFGEGLYNNANVRIYRIENGIFKLVRIDKIKSNGAHLHGWIEVTRHNQIIPANHDNYKFNWDWYNNPNANYFFSIAAVDKYGRLSSLSKPTDVIPNKIKPTRIIQKTDIGKYKNKIINFTPEKSIFKFPSDHKPPNNFKYKGIPKKSLVFSWDRSFEKDVIGYKIFKTYRLPSEIEGYYLEMDGTPNNEGEYIKSGDIVIVEKKLYTLNRDRDLSNRVWGLHTIYRKLSPGLLDFFPNENPAATWSLKKHTSDTKVNEPGESFLEINLGNVNKELTLYNHSGIKQHFYDVLEEKKYVIEVWLRKSGPGNVQFSRTSDPRNPVKFNVTDEWKKFTEYFTPKSTQTGKRAHRMSLQFKGPGTFQVDNFRVYRADSKYLNMLPEDIVNLEKSNIHSLRTHGLIKTGFSTYDMQQITNSAGLINGTSKLNTLPQQLKLAKRVRTNPWIQLEYHMSPQEWLGLIEYLAAPYDQQSDTSTNKPWAYKRFKQGQEAPWLSEFDTVYFEFSNETWNPLFSPWTFKSMTDSKTGEKYNNGEVYGKMQELIISIFKSSPYWNDGLNDKIKFVIGGWGARPYYGINAISNSPSSNLLTVAAYNGGWDENEGPPRLNKASFFNVLAHVNQSAIPGAIKYAHKIQDLNTNQNRNVRMGTYEAGPGYALNGLNNARIKPKQKKEQEMVMKSLAAGIATLDSFLAKSYKGYSIQNFFTFNHGQHWSSHAKWYDGGQAYPSWKTISLFNNEGTGDMLRVITEKVPRIDLKKYKRRKAVSQAPMVATYATRNNDRFNVFVISRMMPNYPDINNDGYVKTSLNLPFSKSKKVTLYKMTGNPEDNNLKADNVKIKKEIINVTSDISHFKINKSTGADKRGLPPSSLFLYVFEGISY